MKSLLSILAISHPVAPFTLRIAISFVRRRIRKDMKMTSPTTLTIRKEICLRNNLKSNIKRVHSIQTDTKITNKFAPLTASAYLCITMKEVLVISSSLRQRSAPDAFAEAFARGAAEAGNAALEEACELGKKII